MLGRHELLAREDTLCQINISNVVDALDEKGYALEGYRQVGENEHGI